MYFCQFGSSSPIISGSDRDDCKEADAPTDCDDLEETAQGAILGAIVKFNQTTDGMGGMGRLRFIFDKGDVSPCQFSVSRSIKDIDAVVGGE